MAIVVILVLGILWAAVLLPPILRSRAEGGGSGVAGGVGEVMSMLTSSFGRGRGTGGDHDLPGMQPLMGPVGPVASMGPMRTPGGMSRAQKRRRDVLIGLLVAVGITLVMALFSGGSMMFLVLHLLADICLGVYIYMLLQMKSHQHERRTKVRPLEPTGRHLRSIPGMAPEPASRREPALLLRRTATS